VSIAATLFDMDGLLIDSEILWHKAESKYSAPLVFRCTRVRPVHEGRVRERSRGLWFARYPWRTPSGDAVVDMLLERVGSLVESEGRLLPGAIRALDLTSERGPVALASSTPLALIKRCLAHFDLSDRFASVHSAEFEPYGKPHPGVFLSAAASLGIEPTRCLVFEDSGAGVIAARAASMSVVAVPTPRTGPTSNSFWPISFSTRSMRCRRTGSTHSSPRDPFESVSNRMAEGAGRVVLDPHPTVQLIEREGLGLGWPGFEEECHVPECLRARLDLFHERETDALTS